jgi:hypothetical protein
MCISNILVDGHSVVHIAAKMGESSREGMIGTQGLQQRLFSALDSLVATILHSKFNAQRLRL